MSAAEIPTDDLTGSVTFPAKGKESAEPGLPDERLQAILAAKDTDAASQHGRPEAWQIIDDTIIVFDHAAPPAWLKPVLDARDENGNTDLAAPTLTALAANQARLVDKLQRDALKDGLLPRDARELAASLTTAVDKLASLRQQARDQSIAGLLNALEDADAPTEAIAIVRSHLVTGLWTFERE